MGSLGTTAKWAFEPGSGPHTFDSSSERHDLISDSVSMQQAIVRSQGLTGSRGGTADRNRLGVKQIGGTIAVNPSPRFLEEWLPRIMGAGSSGSFTLSETLPYFGMLADRVGGTFEYKDCKVVSAVFSGSSSQDDGLVSLAIDIVAKDQATGTSMPTLTLGTTLDYEPLLFSDLVIEMESSERDIEDFTLTIGQSTSPRFRNSVTAKELLEGERLISLSTSTPFTSTEMSDLYNQGKAGASASLVFTNGAVSTTFTLNKLQVPAQDPIIQGPDEILLPLDGLVSGSGSNLELTVTNDATV